MWQSILIAVAKLSFIADWIRTRLWARVSVTTLALLITAGALAPLLYGQEATKSRIVVHPPGPDCGIEPIKIEASSTPWHCFPPYQTPTYTKPLDNTVVFGSLLESAGISSAVNSGQDWVGVAAGNFCPASEKQLALMSKQATASMLFTILGGPTPHTLPAFIPNGMAGYGLGIAAGKLDDSPFDQIVAVQASGLTGAPDLFVFQLDNTCHGHLVDAMTFDSSAFVGVAVGNFLGNGKKQIALLRAVGDPQLFLVELNQTTLKLGIVHMQNLDFDTAQPSNWKALAAGDIDGDGTDELIAAREVSTGNGHRTIFALKWDATNVAGTCGSLSSCFRTFATSPFGNDGTSNWSSATAGDFNAGGRKAIVLVKNQHPNFVVLDLPPGATLLRELSTADLDSAEQANWTGLAATDWLSGDQGADELIAVRAVRNRSVPPPSVFGAYRTNVFVYGNPFHRVSRDTALERTKAQWANANGIGDFSIFANVLRGIAPSPRSQATVGTGQWIETLKQWLRGSYTNTFLWLLKKPGDYTQLVQFLDATKDWGVDGTQLRVWITLVPPRYVIPGPGLAPGDNCSQPEDTLQLTSWKARDFFNLPPNPTDDDIILACRNMLAWASVIGRLAQDFPHLVGLAIDDFSEQLPYADNPPSADKPFTSDYLAEMKARMRSQAPWLNFSPYVYYYAWGSFTLFDDYTRNYWTDFGLTLDSMVFFFRNEKMANERNECVIGPTPDCDRTVNNAPDEIRDMSRLLPAGRKFQLGIYWVGLSTSNAGQPPSPLYDFQLTGIALRQPIISGTIAYGLQTPDMACNDDNFIFDRFCALWAAYKIPP